MQRGRAYEEARRLGEEYPVYYSEADGVVEVRSYPFPEGWEPRVGALRYELPSNYPQSMPTVYVPSESRFRGSSPLHQRRHVHANGDDGWSKWCIEEHNAGWKPGEDTLVKLTRMMRASLTHPGSDNPMREIEG